MPRFGRGVPIQLSGGVVSSARLVVLLSCASDEQTRGFLYSITVNSGVVPCCVLSLCAYSLCGLASPFEAFRGPSWPIVSRRGLPCPVVACRGLSWLVASWRNVPYCRVAKIFGANLPIRFVEGSATVFLLGSVFGLIAVVGLFAVVGLIVAVGLTSVVALFVAASSKRGVF